MSSNCASTGAAHDADALRIAKAIAHSPLVKTAWAGCDPNWGRLVAAIGYSGAQIDPERIDISFGELPICRNGGRAAEFDEAAAHAISQQPEFSISIDLHQGPGSCVFWTTDLTHRVHPHQRRLLDLGNIKASSAAGGLWVGAFDGIFQLLNESNREHRARRPMNVPKPST